MKITIIPKRSQLFLSVKGTFIEFGLTLILKKLKYPIKNFFKLLKVFTEFFEFRRHQVSTHKRRIKEIYLKKYVIHSFQPLSSPLQ